MSMRDPSDGASPSFHPQDHPEPARMSVYDGFVEHDVHDMHADGAHQLSPGHPPESWRDSTYSTSSGPTVL